MGHLGGARLLRSRLARTLAPPKSQTDPFNANGMVFYQSISEVLGPKCASTRLAPNGIFSLWH